jgi:hypothetical protein
LEDSERFGGFGKICRIPKDLEDSEEAESFGGFKKIWKRRRKDLEDLEEEAVRHEIKSMGLPSWTEPKWYLPFHFTCRSFHNAIYSTMDEPPIVMDGFSMR